MKIDMKPILFLLVFLIPLPSVCADPYYSQLGQDQYVYETFFKGKKDGFFVDVGAYDGVTGSNSYFFEKTLGWDGICVEPIPELFQKLEKQRNCININACVGEQGVREFLKICGQNEMLSGLIEKYDPRHRALVDSIASQCGDKHEVILVKCLPLMEILKAHNITHVDYLSIDTEGGEISILKAIDFDLVTIDVIDVENNYYSNEFNEFLTSKGYKLDCRIGVDEIFTRINPLETTPSAP